MIVTLADACQQILAERTEYIQREYARCCRPILGILDDNTMQHIGSAILLKNEGKRYLITASHVIDEHEHSTLATSINQEIIILDGDFYQTAKVSGKRDEDRYDFAWKNVSADLSDVSEDNFYSGPISLNQIESPGQSYTLLGYPGSKNKPRHSTRQIMPRIFAFTNRGQHNGDFIEVEHKQDECRDSAGRIVMSPKLEGISGGGLFALGDLGSLGNLTAPPYGILAGIITEKRVGTSNITSTKIGVIIDAINERER